MVLPQNWEPVLRRSVLVCLLTIAAGTLGFMITEGWGPWQSLYFTLVTLTTVGYGDYGVSVAGKAFSVFIMLVGIGTISYCLSQIVQYATSRSLYSEACMIRQASLMNNHYIVCGMGQTGLRVARKLVGEGHDLVVIDSDEEHIKQLRADGFVALHGDAASDHVLLFAGIERAKGLAAVTSCDSSNAMICLGASAQNPDLHIIARAECDSAVDKLRRAGATNVINPSRYSGDGIVESLVRPEISHLLYGGSTDSLRFAEYKLNELKLEHTSSLRELLESHPRLVLIGTRDDDGEVEMRPDLEQALDTNSTIIFAGTIEQLNQFGSSVRNAA